MLRELKRLEPTPPSKTEQEYLTQLNSFIKQNKNVFIIGANGTGKSFLVREAKKLITDRKCYQFDMRKLFEKSGGLNVYQTIIKELTGSTISFEKLENYVNHQLIDDLNQEISSPKVLFFDHFQATNMEFYHHFSNICRKINLTGIKQPGKGCHNIVMVFSGTLILNDVADIATSPLWGITEKLYVKPHKRLEANFNNYARLHKIVGKPPGENLLEHIFQLTKGHKYLAKTLIQVIIAYDLLNKSKDEILDKYIDHLWKVLNSELEFLDEANQKLRFHFFNIIEYLETNVNIMMVILDLYHEKSVFSEYPSYQDQVYITGLVDIDDNKQYHFSNDIYKKFIAKLLEGYRAGDYCLYHAENQDLWLRAKKIYQRLQDRLENRKFTRMLTTKRPASSHIAHQIIQKLKQNTTAQDLANEIAEILTLMYNISKWSIYRFYQSENEEIKLNLIPVFTNHGERVQETDTVQNFIKQVIKEKRQMIDWTGSWQGVPVMIGRDFKVLFIYKIIAEELGWGRVIPTFIKDAMMLYYNHLEQEKMSDQIQYFKESITGPIQSKAVYRKGEQEYWEASKYFLSYIDIKDFTLHEILDYNLIRSSHSSQVKLTSHQDLIRIDKKPDIKEFRDKFIGFSKGKIQTLTKQQKQLTGCTMQIPGNMMIIETNYSQEKFNKLQQPFNKYFTLIYQVLEQNIDLYQTFRQLNAIKEILEGSQDYIYIVSHTRDVIYINKRLLNALQIEEGEFNKLKGNQEVYFEEFINFAFNELELLYKEVSFNKSGKEIKTLTVIRPLIHEKNVFAVAVIMQEMNYHHVLHEAQRNLIKIQEIHEFETELTKYLNMLGYEYLTQYKRIEKTSDNYINEENGSLTCIKFDKDTHLGKVSIWHRKRFSDQLILNKWKTRLEKTSYQLKEDQSWPEYSTNKPNQDNFWITVPILYDKEIIKLFCMGWHNDKRWDSEAVNIAKLRQIESFARTVGLMWENISEKVYQNKFQSMITHGIIEPLQLMRFYLEPVIEMTDKEKRKKEIDIVDAHIEIVHSTLQSILSIYVGKTRVQKEKICLNDFVSDKLKFFQAYATGRVSIDFEISLPSEPIMCYTDPIMLNQILNNLVGNSIRQLKKIKKSVQPCPKIQIKLNYSDSHLTFEISDNGSGLPKQVKAYFEETIFITKGMVPSGRLGIGFSKEIAEMLGGKLAIINPPELGEGTTYILSLPLMR